MGREWPYGRRMSERQKMEFRAYARNPAELAEINEFLSKYRHPIASCAKPGKTPVRVIFGSKWHRMTATLY
jgi:hypothetical protein